MKFIIRALARKRLRFVDCWRILLLWLLLCFFLLLETWKLCPALFSCYHTTMSFRSKSEHKITKFNVFLVCLLLLLSILFLLFLNIRKRCHGCRSARPCPSLLLHCIGLAKHIFFLYPSLLQILCSLFFNIESIYTFAWHMVTTITRPPDIMQAFYSFVVQLFPIVHSLTVIIQLVFNCSCNEKNPTTTTTAANHNK